MWHRNGVPYYSGNTITEQLNPKKKILLFFLLEICKIFLLKDLKNSSAVVSGNVICGNKTMA